MDESKISVVLVDDQSLIRQGMRYIINSQPDMVVVGEASDVPSAIEVVLRLRPDIVLMDIQMPQQNGIEATVSILERLPSTKIILLTTFDVTDYVFDGIRAGAVGYILKTPIVRNCSLIFDSPIKVQPFFAARPPVRRWLKL